ncbi:DNA polymerase III subunit alpha, partial [candidate division GN15 bacterium]
MKFANFVHLHTHSQYSLLDGACRLDAVIDLAKHFKMPALAITDHGNMFGAIEFYKAASKAGIKPIVGIEAYVAAGSRFDKKPSTVYPNGGFHMILLAKNLTGYRNLIKLSSAGFLDGFYHRPRIDKELLRQHSEGLIATSACLMGEVNWHLQRGETEQAVASAREYHAIFGDGNFFLEIQNHGLEKEQQVIPKIAAISRETGIPMVVTNDCHYLRREDWEAHDALLCIQTDKKVADADRMRYNTDQIYFKSPEEMAELFGDFKDALDNTVRIAEECNLELELGQLKLPVFPIPAQYVNADQFLYDLCEQGVKERYTKITPEISKRLEYELGVIRQMGYAGYFLIVKDFCDYARSQKIPVGPGRGSAAGSLVSYALRITNVDPIRFNLLFERFLNPDRISMPDIDIDFADRGRDQIIKYVIDKYGAENVTQIITFGTMAARAAVRDVGRVLGLAYSEVDRIAKMIPAT